MKRKSVFAEPKFVNDVKDCYFYHTIDLPGHGTIEGNWDLREGFSEYLGGVDFKGKKVLEIGTANGAICFEMERAGASVIGFDLSKEDSWDVVPHPRRDFNNMKDNKKNLTEKLNNAFWFCHRLLNSKAKMVHGNIYNIPQGIGSVDIVTFGAILLHVRDPFLALQTGLKFARETVIVTELVGKDEDIKNTGDPLMKLLPDPDSELHPFSWWRLYPGVVVRMVGLLGFGNVEVTYHSQKFKDTKMKMYTVVAHRTGGFAHVV